MKCPVCKSKLISRFSNGLGPFICISDVLGHEVEKDDDGYELYENELCILAIKKDKFTGIYSSADEYYTPIVKFDKYVPFNQALKYLKKADKLKTFI